MTAPSQSSTASPTDLNTNGNGHLSTDALAGMFAQLPPARQERIKNHVVSEAKAEFEQDPTEENTDPWAITPRDGGEMCTDGGNAERLHRYIGNQLRYVPQAGWYVYSGKFWMQDDNTAQVMAWKCAKLIYQEAANIVAEGDGEKDLELKKRKKELARHAYKTDQAKGIRDMLFSASSLEGITARMGDLDADPWLLNVLNGTLDLRIGKIRPHNPADLCTQLVPVEYHPDAPADIWIQFLQDIFGPKEGVDTDGLVDFMRRAVGYCLTGR